jgi:hypothetical protein
VIEIELLQTIELIRIGLQIMNKEI